MSNTVAIRHPSARRRIATLPVRRALTRLAYMAALHQGCCGRVARECARYACHLRAAGHSAGWAIGRSVRYARVRLGKCTWDEPEAA